MTDLVEFLRARFDEDARFAHSASGLLGVATAWHEVDWLHYRGLSRADAQHVNRWSPDRVLADVEAKRRIVELEPARFSVITSGNGAWEMHKAVLKLLALPYADHPDYREEWRP